MGVVVNPQGPLQSAELVQIIDTVFFDRTLPPIVEPLPSDENYIVEMGDKPDLLAGRRVTNDRWWWVIMQRNRSTEDGEVDMRLWPNDFVPGETIKIPGSATVSSRGIST